MSNHKTYYDVLGVSRTADLRSITQAYRQIVKEYHPDKRGEEYRDIFDRSQTAYDILKDETKRLMYDLTIDDLSDLDESDVDYENIYMKDLGDDDSENESDEEVEYKFYCHNNVYYLIPNLNNSKNLSLDEFSELIVKNSVYKITATELDSIETEIGKKNSKGEYIHMYPKLYILRKRLEIIKKRYISSQTTID